MSGRRVGQKVFDWAKLARQIPQEVKSDFSAFRARHEACRASLSALPEKSEPIDWDYYRRNISTPGLVDSFQKQFEALTVPYPKDTTTARLEEHKKQVEVQVAEAIKESEKTVQDMQKQLDKINAEKPYEDMTIDEYLAERPELKKTIDDDIKNMNWYLPREFKA